MKKIFLTAILALALLLASCKPGGVIAPPDLSEGDSGGDGTVDAATAEVTDIGFEHVDPEIETTMTVTCTEGTANACKLERNVVTFSGITEDSIYTVTGDLGGYIVIDIDEDLKFELVLQGARIQSSNETPIIIKNGDKVTLTAKKDTVNYIYDLREAVDPTAEGVYSGAVHAECDLQIGGKGSLTVESKNNNGIHTKDDLEIKNLKLTVTAVDNCLKGNDSVTVESGDLVLISRGGDGIKTSNSDISDKGNQRGNITLLGGKIDIYAAADGIDASYNAEIEGETVLNIYTDKFSDYSEEVTASGGEEYYIKVTDKDHNYSAKFTNDSGESIWVNAGFDSEDESFGGFGGGGRPGRPGSDRSSVSSYYYKLEKPAGYSKMQIFVYSASQKAGQESDYTARSETVTVNENYDTVSLKINDDAAEISWTNKQTMQGPGGFPGGGGMGGPGGMFGEGNSNKSDHSAKGIKAANEIIISGGTLNIKSYDDGLHANADAVLENGKTPTGNVIVSGGDLTIYSNDDGIHGDGASAISGGVINITNSYEGVEGNTVLISGGKLSVKSSDDGINSTVKSGAGVEISGGIVYIFANGDGIDSNSRTSYQGIVFSGGNTLVISTSGGNSAIDTEQGYTYSGGYVCAVMPQGGMSSESTHCQNFNSVAQKTNAGLTDGGYLTVGEVLTFKSPASIRGLVIFIGDKNAEIKTASSSSASLDENGVCWH